MLYVPTVMLYFVGVSVYVLGPGHQGLADNKMFASIASLTLLALLTYFNILGLGVGKWINNFGAIGTFVAAAVLIGLGIVIWFQFGSTISATDFKIPANPKFVLNSFGVICFGLVGLELASVMGDEIKDPRRTLPGAVALGRRSLGRSIHWGHTDPADRGWKKRQRASGNRAGGDAYGRPGRDRLDLHSLCPDVEHVDRGNWLRVDGRLSPHSICRWA